MAQALRVVVVPELKQNDLVVSLSPGGCPDYLSSPGYGNPAPANTEESAEALLVDTSGADDYEVGVNTPNLVQPGEWFVVIKNMNKVGAAPARHFTITADAGARACAVPVEIGDDLCGGFVNYPALAVQATERDRAPPGLALSTTDPRGGARACRGAALEVWCEQVFPECDPNSGVAVQPCRKTCDDLGDACTEALGVAAVTSVRAAVCNLAPAAPYHSPFAPTADECMKHRGYTGNRNAAGGGRLGAPRSAVRLSLVVGLFTAAAVLAAGRRR